MVGYHPTGRGYYAYRCNSRALKGVGACPSGGTPEMREDRILPIVMRLFGESLRDISEYLTATPDELTSPNKHQREEQKQLEQDIAKLESQIDQASNNLAAVDDKRIRQKLVDLISKMCDEQEQKKAQLKLDNSSKPVYLKDRVTGKRITINDPWTRDQLNAVTQFREKFEKEAISVPIPLAKMDEGEKLMAHFHRDVFAEFKVDYDPNCEYVMLDRRVVNEALRTLGAEVRLRWRTRKVTMMEGTVRNSYTPLSGRFRLDRFDERISLKDGVTYRDSRRAWR
jgi:protein-tyrosine-phosphatase